ncbi:tripartite tricarboxylate transporter TctA family protein [Halalkalicoccus paucihalophilus]|uniref:Tripartite tricarboxylate transporter TctA family protein n=1 Tax=Halalkalicoccus paucihalophilus TaxID=1008153 RepID=A0A151AGJ5_9EURY|nr:tripartite tricarboxylate transporter permease [Halalkalicoccus paucihalophilus]KYH26789.1 tripartite tricarboxylate transporter TctA family protein [Halalkalicoccus paucihalophilus]
MDLGVTISTDPALALYALTFVLGGALLGTLSGLTPGLHANNFALLLAGAAPLVPGPPLLVGAAMLSAGVVHTFLDVVPALALGVPDAEMAVAALPGHRLVLEGRGYEALRLSAMGSALAVVFAVPLAVPMTFLMIKAWPTLAANMPLVLGTVVAIMLLTENSLSGFAGGVLAFGISALLGMATLDLDPAAPLYGDVLAPLFAGLFGAPILIDAMGGSGIPEQTDKTITIPRRAVLLPAAAGALAGAVVGYLPGVSSAIAAVLALLALPGSSGDRGFVIATSGVNTANTIFALFALVALGAPRTGVLVAVERAEVPLNLPVLLSAVAIAAAIGFVLVLVVGDWYLRVIGTVDYAKLCVVVLTLLVVLSYAFAGAIGIVVFLVSALVGFIPVRFGANRVHLMGVLIGPIALWYY